ncbi:D-3-phosphoglycerate dehydrogenase [Arthrobacter sp. CAN_A214]|uniref:hydroxyacid dehydrogenase n=1 Tax=Arthrobacter sp. CAN_A214 TaxID=2787720 RepID=UPI0018CA7967
MWIPHPVHEQALENLSSLAHVALGYGPNKVEFGAVASKVEGILLRTARVTAEQIDAAPLLKIIARHGVGTDTVDVRAATAAGVVVTNTPQANTVAVAEHAIALLLALRRNLISADRANQAGSSSNSRSQLTGRELRGSTLGLVGFGRIAAEVARIAASGFGMNVIAFDPGLTSEEIQRRGARPVSFEDLLQDSDALSIHVPLIPQTRHLIGESQMAKMKQGSVIINTARGGVVDDDALLNSLNLNHLGGAGLDVAEVEPLPDGHPLLARCDVIITPHIGGQTEESLIRVALEAADYICQVLRGEFPSAVVNQLSQLRDS